MNLTYSIDLQVYHKDCTKVNKFSVNQSVNNMHAINFREIREKRLKVTRIFIVADFIRIIINVNQFLEI